MLQRCFLIINATKKFLSSADSDLKNFSVGSTDRAQKFHGSADLHTPIHPPPHHTRAGCNRTFWRAFIGFWRAFRKVI